METSRRPTITILAGPNGAGKTTLSEFLVPPGVEFINADIIARDLASTVTPRVELRAARLALERMEALASERKDFVLETTLANRSLVSRIQRLRQGGYWFNLHYVWVPSSDLSLERVADRVRRGGHDVPDETIRRRYRAGLVNFFRHYASIADVWSVYDNSRATPVVVARGGQGLQTDVQVRSTWERMQEAANDSD